MAQTRLATIHVRENYTADKTETINIDLSDVISRMVITYEPDNNPSGANATAHPVRCISNIELVDGSTTLWKTTGAEAMAVDFYDRERVTPSIMCYLNGMTSEMIINMNFGRFLWDPQFGFDPTKFINPQLKITMDIDAGGDESDDGYLTVMAHAFDEKRVSPRGFLMTKEFKPWTPAAASNEATKLPTDYPYRQLFLRAARYGAGPEYMVDTVKLSEEVDKKIPLNHSMYQIMRHVASQYKPYEETMLVHGTGTAQNFYCTPTYWPMFTGSLWRGSYVTDGVSIYGGDGGQFTHCTEAANRNHQVYCKGYAPHGLVPLLPKPDMDPASWYNVTGIKSLDLNVVGGASPGTTETIKAIIQQERRY